MKYYWNAGVMNDVLALPATVVDKHIRLAGSAQLKVLLWLARAGHGTFDADLCAAAIGLSPADCTDALQYWIETGVLCVACAAEAAVKPAKSLTVVQTAAQPVTVKPVTVTSVPVSTPIAALTAVPSRPPVARPQPVKPQMRDVLQQQKNDPVFAGMLDMAASRLGRPLSHGDTETLLYLYHTAGMPAEVILMVLAYAVSIGKQHMRYIEKVVLDWLDLGIDNVAAAEAQLCRMERRSQAWDQVSVLLGLVQSPTAAQLDAVERWIYDWHMPDELLRLAYTQCMERNGKFQSAYMSKILEHWHLDNIDTEEKALAAAGGKRARVKTASSLEPTEYEKQVMSYIPVYKDATR